MTHSRTFRILFVGSLVAFSLTVASVCTWLLWPQWQKHRAVTALMRVVRGQEAPTKWDKVYSAMHLSLPRDIDGCVALVRKVHAEREAVSALAEAFVPDDSSPQSSIA